MRKCKFRVKGSGMAKTHDGRLWQYFNGLGKIVWICDTCRAVIQKGVR